MSDSILKQFAAAMELGPDITDIVTAEDRKLSRATLDGASCNNNDRDKSRIIESQN